MDKYEYSNQLSTQEIQIQIWKGFIQNKQDQLLSSKFFQYCPFDQSISWKLFPT